MEDMENFLLVHGYPECKNTKPIIETINEPCPNCGGKVIVKKSKKGRKFYVCENNPDKGCEYISWNNPKKDEEKSHNKKEEKK